MKSAHPQVYDGGHTRGASYVGHGHPPPVVARRGVGQRTRDARADCVRTVGSMADLDRVSEHNDATFASGREVTTSLGSNVRLSQTLRAGSFPRSHAAKRVGQLTTTASGGQAGDAAACLLGCASLSVSPFGKPGARRDPIGSDPWTTWTPLIGCGPCSID